MQEKELLSKLNILKEVKPSDDWKSNNRELLLAQIYAGQEKTSDKFSFFTFKLPFELLSTARPAMVMAFIMFLVFGSGAWGMQMAKNTKPGDSLYAAKRMSEQTQLALTFDEKEKVKLQLDFAANRANELSAILAEPQQDSVAKVEKVEKLVNDFNTQIKQAKSALVKINPDAKIANETKPTDQDETLFSANASKDKTGLSYSDGQTGTKTEGTTQAQNSVTPQPLKTENTTTTPAQAENASSTVQNNLNTTETKAILEQAKELLNKDDLTATMNKIDEASQTINNVQTGQVKGEEEAAATTTEDTK